MSLVEVLIGGIANWFQALPITVPLLLAIAVVVRRREQRARV